MARTAEEQKEYSKKYYQERKEAEKYLLKYQTGTKGMEYHVYNGRGSAKDTIERINNFFIKYPNLQDKDIWVIQDDLGYRVGINPQKEDEQTKKWWDENKDHVSELTLIDQFRRWGSQGGKKTGASKVRGDSEYYRKISKKRKVNP